jgi:hypothetical protein
MARHYSSILIADYLLTVNCHLFNKKGVEPVGSTPH